MKKLKLGMVGLDTSHVTAFTEILHNENHPYHMPGAEVVIAYPGGSPDMELSISRVDDFTKRMREEFDVKIVDSIEEVADQADAIFLETVDGRMHFEQFKRIAPYGKPVFIDKPLTVSTKEAEEIFELAETHDAPVMSSSALRYAEGFTRLRNQFPLKEVYGMDCYGPLSLEEHHGLFWYGIHTANMLFSVLDAGCQKVTVHYNDDHELIIGEWEDGRIGTIRGNRISDNAFGGTIYTTENRATFDTTTDEEPFYASLMKEVMAFFQTRRSPIDKDEMIEIIRFLEAAEESRQTGQTISL